MFSRPSANFRCPDSARDSEGWVRPRSSAKSVWVTPCFASRLAAEFEVLFTFCPFSGITRGDLLRTVLLTKEGVNLRAITVLMTVMGSKSHSSRKIDFATVVESHAA